MSSSRSSLSANGTRRAWARLFRTGLAEEMPGQFTAQVAMARRRGRIFLDYLRNQRGSTAVLPWSARARDGAPVAVPIAWDELSEFDSAARFHIGDINTLLRRARGVALRGWGSAEQQLPTAWAIGPPLA